MSTPLPVYIGRDAVAQLVRYSRGQGLSRFVLIADQNTYAALAHKVETALRAAACDVLPIVLEGDEVIADAHHILRVLTRVDAQDRTYISVGGGTLTDITRFVSHRTKTRFIALPSAPSVDGFTSIGAPLVVDGLKLTWSCQPPMALFADLDTLMAAPRLLVAAGFGDMVGKLLSTADWELGHVLWNERYDSALATRFQAAARVCTDVAHEIKVRSERGVQALMEGLVESGFGMLTFGNSAPASGGEHHMSHYWEIKLLREQRPAIYHGLKVGVASILTAQRYQALGRLTPAEVADRLRWSRALEPDAQIAHIRATFGGMADELIREQARFLDWDAAKFDAVRRRIVDAWPEVQRIARAVPAPEQLADWLRAVGEPETPGAIGLGDDEVGQALESSHYMRNRFTVNKLWFALGLPPRGVAVR